MKSFFIIVFYKLHVFAKFVSKDNLYQYTAMYLLSLLIFLNCITIYAYYNCLVEHSTNRYPSRPVVLTLAFLIAGIIYVVFVRNKKYEFFFQKFLKSEDLKGGYGTLITILYIVASLMIAISSIWLKCKQ